MFDLTVTLLIGKPQCLVVLGRGSLLGNSYTCVSCLGLMYDSNICVFSCAGGGAPLRRTLFFFFFLLLRGGVLAQ